jgi:hypothetical protein
MNAIQSQTNSLRYHQGTAFIRAVWATLTFGRKFEI